MNLSFKPLFASVFAAALAACSQPEGAQNNAGSVDPAAEATNFTVLVGGTEIGSMVVAPEDNTYYVDFEFSNNGRGPTIAENLTLNDMGLPLSWTIDGSSTFGNPINESFDTLDGEARWTDATGSDHAIPAEPAFYVPNDGGPYWLAVAARALMDAEDMTLPALPGGQLRLTEIEQLDVSNGSATRSVTAWALSGTSLNPTYFLMDGRAFFALITPGFTVLETGYEVEDERLRNLAAGYGAARYEDIKIRVAHNYDAPVRIRNVRIFDPATESMGEPVSVVVAGNTIQSIDALDVVTQDGEVEIDGGGGSLIPGMFEMHGHMGESAAILNIVAGVTSLRDMGNNNEVLGALIDRVESGQLIGPRVYRSGFIEGQSDFSSNNGIIVSSEEEAVAAVETYAATGDYFQIKIYNSMNPEWVPAMIQAARDNNLRVAGHVPAFTNANAMIEAGYDELTHINQIMLGWVLDEGEDTRSLLRLTALRRLPALDLNSAPVQATIDAMVANNVAVDPTLAIHEALLLSRNGELAQGTIDYIDHMPVDTQRGARTAWADIATPLDDEQYRGANEQIYAVLRMMRERGVFMVPGTDLGGSFTYHRELELYQEIGMTAPEILAWATLGMAEYLGVDDTTGSIEVGKLADFFLIPGDPTEDLKNIKTISMVAADGVFYYPTEIYPDFGIVPFTEVPNIIGGN